MLGYLKIANTRADKVGEKEMAQVASIASGGDNPTLTEFFELVRQAEGGTPVGELLRSPTAISLLKKAVANRQQGNEEDREVFCRCPNCQFGFTTEL